MKASGWNGHIRVDLTTVGDEDVCSVFHDAAGTTRLLYLGSLDKHDDPRGNEIKLYEEDESNG